MSKTRPGRGESGNIKPSFTANENGHLLPKFKAAGRTAFVEPTDSTASPSRCKLHSTTPTTAHSQRRLQFARRRAPLCCLRVLMIDLPRHSTYVPVVLMLFSGPESRSSTSSHDGSSTMGYKGRETPYLPTSTVPLMSVILQPSETRLGVKQPMTFN